MIIKPKINRSFPAMCRYVMQVKNPEKKADVLATHGVRSDGSAHMAADFDVVRSMRPRLEKAVMHVILSFPAEEKGKVTNDLMVSIAKDYMREMKISPTNTQWVAVRHNDKDHPHLHLIINRVDLDGQTVSDKFCRSRSIDAAKKLEKAYGLVVADEVGQKQAREIGPTPAQAAAKTAREIRLADWSRARQTIGRALSYTKNQDRNLEELSELLRPRRIATEVYRDKNGEPQGVVFVLDGHRVKGTQLGMEYRCGELTAAIGKNRAAEPSRDLAISWQELAQAYSAAKVLSGYAQAKEKVRSASPNLDISKSRGFEIGD